MKHRIPRTRLGLLAMLATLPWVAARAQTGAGAASVPAAAPPAPRRKQFVYMLRITPKYQAESAWTPADNAAVGRHFQRLQEATRAGQVVLAGRSTEPLDKTFGIVIFEADDEAAARAFMEADPAIVAGLMTATLHPYSVALMRR